MNRGTPEQVRQIRHRRRVTLGSFLMGGLFWFIVSAIVRSFFGDPAASTFIVLFWLFGGCGFLIFTLTYWVCPVCKHYFHRGSDGRHCRNCNTTFEA
jgi:hypothetical protein